MTLFLKRDRELMERAAHVLRQQSLRVRAAREEALHWQMLTLMSQRAARDIAASWLESVDDGDEPDLDELRAMVISLSDSVSYLEEHFEYE